MNKGQLSPLSALNISAPYCCQHLLPHPDSVSLAYNDDYIIRQYSSQNFVTPIYGFFFSLGFKINLNCEVHLFSVKTMENHVCMGRLELIYNITIF